MDKIQKNMFLCLRLNGRASLSDISRETATPITTIFERMKKLNFVKQNATLLDFQKMGYAIRAFLAINALDKEAVQDFLMNCPSINSLCRINNGLDFFCEAIFPGLKEFEQFNDTLMMLKAKARVYLVVEELSRERLFTKKEHFSLLE